MIKHSKCTTLWSCRIQEIDLPLAAVVVAEVMFYGFRINLATY